MPGVDVLAAAGALSTQCPECRVIMLTTFGRAGYLRQAMDASAVEIVVKDAPPEVLADAIQRVMDGERILDQRLAALVLAAGESLPTARERDMLAVTRSGASVAEIAAQRATDWTPCASPTNKAGFSDVA